MENLSNQLMQHLLVSFQTHIQQNHFNFRYGQKLRKTNHKNSLIIVTFLSFFLTFMIKNETCKLFYNILRQNKNYLSFIIKFGKSIVET